MRCWPISASRSAHSTRRNARPPANSARQVSVQHSNASRRSTHATQGEVAFAYSSDLARLLAAQLRKFVTINRHHVAAQAANLDFWAAEVRHSLGVIDGYKQRFEVMRSAQSRYTAEHRTMEFDLDDPRHTLVPAQAPRRIPHRELEDAKKQLREAMYQFLVRCFREKHVDEQRLRSTCDRLGIGVEASDLHRKK